MIWLHGSTGVEVAPPDPGFHCMVSELVGVLHTNGGGGSRTAQVFSTSRSQGAAVQVVVHAAPPSQVSPSAAWTTPSPQEVQSVRQPVPTDPAVPSQVSPALACSTPSPQEVHALEPVVRQPAPTVPAVPSQVSPWEACSTPSPQEVQSVRQPVPTVPAVPSQVSSCQASSTPAQPH